MAVPYCHNSPVKGTTMHINTQTDISMQHLPIKWQGKEKGKWTNKQKNFWHQETERYRCSTSPFIKFYWEYFSENTVFSCSGLLDVAFVWDHPRSELLYLHRKGVFLLNTLDEGRNNWFCLSYFQRAGPHGYGLTTCCFSASCNLTNVTSLALFLCGLGQLLTSALKILLLANILNWIARIHTGHFLLFS